MTKQAQGPLCKASGGLKPTPVGSRVRIEREAPAAGTWKRYAGRLGTIVTVNDDWASGTLYREYGVAFKPVRLDPDRPGGTHRQGSDTTWFRPGELTVVHPVN